MNNKTLIIVIVALLAIGGALVLAGKFAGKNQNTVSTQQSSVSNQSMQNRGDNKGAPVEKIKNVTLTQDGFTPQTITVNVGERVVWLNKTGTDASVNSDNYPTNQLYTPLNLGQFGNDTSVQLIFNKAGTYKYHNQLKPDQTGIIIVN